MKNYSVDLASISDKNLLYDFAKEMHFDKKSISKKRIKALEIELL